MTHGDGQVDRNVSRQADHDRAPAGVYPHNYPESSLPSPRAAYRVPAMAGRAGAAHLSPRADDNLFLTNAGAH